MTALLALVSALISGAIHQELIFDNHRAVLSKMIQIESTGLLDSLSSKSEDLGIAMQSNKSFKNAMRDNDTTKIVEMLDNQFHQYFVTAGIIKLEQIVLLDKEFRIIAESTDGAVRIGNFTDQVCSDILHSAAQRTDSNRYAKFDGLCLYNNNPLHAVIVPVGGLRLKGYLLILTDPSHSLVITESELGMPTRIETVDNRTIYQSAEWPTKSKEIFLASHELKTDDGLPIVRVTIAQNISHLYDSVIETRIIVLLVSTMFMLLIIAFGVWLLQKTTLKPLHMLTEKLRLLQNDQSIMGLQIETTGAKEVKLLTKGFNAMSLELGNLYGSLEEMAYMDSLTNLPNRNQFQENLTKYTNIYKKSKKRFTIFLMDLDRFKAVNDTLGHHVGDKLLKEIGKRLHETLRGDDVLTRIDEDFLPELEDDMVARLGGDEFAALFPSVQTVAEAVIVARKLNRSLDEPFMINDHCLTVGLSIGIAMYPEHGEDMHTLVSHADIAMYHAKSRKCGFSIYESVQNTNSLHTLKLEQDLFAAIKKDELELHYQPKIDIDSQHVVGAEALVRWRHPEHGLIMPNDFIPLAEQTGLIQPLSDWVLNKALEECASCIKTYNDMKVSVNLSALNIRDERMPMVISNALEKWSVAPVHLMIELTESTIMTDPELALRVLNTLDAMQVKISIDDFGTGYSSLAYVKNLPVDEIKIDKSFVSEMRSDNNDEAIVRAVLVLAHHMNLSVTAEGVEDVETLNVLHELGCDIAQGYLFAKPMPFAELEIWLQDYAQSLQKQNVS